MKKLISLLLALTLILTAGALSTAAYTVPEGYSISPNEGDMEDILNSEDTTGVVYGYVGDADYTDTITIRDATTIQKAVASLVELSEHGELLSDVDFSGEVTVRDATAIQKWIAGIEVDAPIYHTIYKDMEIDKEIIGEWVCERDGADAINAVFESMADDPMFTENIHVDTFPLKFRYTFKDNGECIAEIDKATLDNSKVLVRKDLEGDFTKYFKAVIDSYGGGITVNQLLKEMGYSSMAAYIKDILTDEMFDEMATPTEDTYFAAEGVLMFSSNPEGFYEYYEIDGDVLTLTGCNQPDELFDSFYPETFTRVK